MDKCKCVTYPEGMSVEICQKCESELEEVKMGKDFSKKTPESSNVAEFSYSSIDRKLYVLFRYGTTYVYKDVPHKVAEEMAAAESVGKFLNSRIKGTYEYEKVG